MILLLHFKEIMNLRMSSLGLQEGVGSHGAVCLRYKCLSRKCIVHQVRTLNWVLGNFTTKL